MTLPSALLMASCVLAGAAAPAQTLVGRPCLFNEYFPEWRCFPAILRDDQGNLTCGRYRLNHGGATSAPPAAGPVCATSTKFLPEPGPQFHFAYLDRDGGIQDLWHTRREEKDRWFAQRLNAPGETAAPPAAGNPSGFLAQNVYHVVYRDRTGGIQDLAYDGSWCATTLNLDGQTTGPAASGDPVQLPLQGQRHVLYRDQDGVLQDLWFEHGWHVRALNQGGLTDAPAAAGEPAGMERLRITHVTYRDVANQVQDLWYDGTWHAQQLTGGGATEAPPPAGDPVTAVLGGGRVPHVIYRDHQGAIQDLSFETSWQARKLNEGGATAAPPARSEPYLMVPPSNWEYVAYVDDQGTGQLLTHFQQEHWVAVPLNAQTPPGGPVEIWKAQPR